MAVHLAVACGVYDGVFLCCLFSNEMFWMGSWTELHVEISVQFLTKRFQFEDVFSANIFAQTFSTPDWFYVY